MKNLFLLISFFVTNLPFALAQSWQWGLEGGSSDVVSSSPPSSGSLLFDSDKDAEGNLYLLSSVGKKDRHVGTYLIPGDTLPENLLLTSLDCSGKHRWSKLISCGFLRNTIGYHMSVSTKGDVYILARLGGVISCRICSPPFPYYPTRIDKDTIFTGDKSAFYLISYTTEGKYKWIRNILPDTVNLLSRDYLPIDVNTDANGDACVLGIFPPKMPIPHSTISIPSTLPDTGQCAPYIITYSRTGTPTSAKMLKGLSFLKSNYQLSWSAMRLRCDIYTNGFYVTGNLNPRLPPENFTPDTMFLNKARLYASLFLISFDQNGNQNWAKQDAFITGGNYILGVEPDPNDGVYIGGNIRDSNTFAGHTFVSELVKRALAIRPGSEVMDANHPFAMKLDKYGNYIWSRHASGINSDIKYPPKHSTILSGDGFAANENFVCLGFRARDIFHFEGIDTMTLNSTFGSIVAILNKNTGKLMRWDSFTIPGFLGSTNLRGYVAAKHNVYFSGNFQTPFKVGKHTVNKPLGSSGFLAVKYGFDCICDTMPAPVAAFTFSGAGPIHFKYTGALPIDSLKWDFGDSTSSDLINPSHVYHKTGYRKVCLTVYSPCGISSYCDNVSVVLGIGETDHQQAIRVYPNPANDYLKAEALPLGSQISIVNLLGQKIISRTAENTSEQIDMSILKSGVYILQIRSPQGHTFHTKITKE